MPCPLVALVDDLRLEFTTARHATDQGEWRAVVHFDGYDVEVEKHQARMGRSPRQQRSSAVRFRRTLDMEDLLHLQKIIAHAAIALVKEGAQLAEDLELGIGANPTHAERGKARSNNLRKALAAIPATDELGGIHGAGGHG